MQADATAAVATYQADLNYKTAMAQSGMQHQNAGILHNAAKALEMQGNDQLGRMVMQEKNINSQLTAAYSSSGVDAGTGSAQVVQGYNASMNQLKRMDGLYAINTNAYDKDWQGTMMDYQSKLTAETAQQFTYAKDMAEWNRQMGISSAGVQQNIANANANATAVQGFGTAVNALASGFSSYASDQYMANRTSPTGRGIGAGGAAVGGEGG
jgi:hypothetical protein